MCGRYTLTIDKSTIEKRFGAKFYIAQQEFEPTYNAAPSQLLPIIRTYHPDRIELGKWGFVREDWNSSHLRPQNNARLETADEKPMFSASFRGRHCLVLADSFYESKTLANGKKQPYRIMLKTGEPFAMAGIYARGRDHELGEAENTTVTFCAPRSPSMLKNNNPDAPVSDGPRQIGHILREERLHYQGPLPRPEDFAAYDRVLRGAADRILKMAENQATHRQAMERRALSGDITKSMMRTVLHTSPSADPCSARSISCCTTSRSKVSRLL